MVRGLVFDLDGVLVHTDELHYRAWKALAGRLGLPFTREQGDRCRGVSRMGSLEILLEGSNRSYTEREKLRMAEEKNDCYRAQLQELTPGDVPERTVETLRELRRRGYRLGLASSSKNAGVILTRTGLDALLDRVVDGNQITRSKPDPEVFLRAAQLLELPPEDCAGVDDALAAVGMGEFARHAPHLLSGGQKQRIAIAGVLAMELECIVLDEATAMLDPVGRREVLSAVHRLNREKGITVVLITHHMNEAEDADRVVVMDDGKVIMDGAPRQVFTQVERLRSMGLTVPDTVDLLDRLRKDGLDVPLTALTVEECADAILAAVSK